MNRNTTVVGVLLEQGADPDSRQGRDKKNRVPLIEAVRASNREIAAALLSAGATVDIRGGIPKVTALMLAAKSGDEGMAELLLSRGADPALVLRGKTAATEARSAGHEVLARRLEEASDSGL